MLTNEKKRLPKTVNLSKGVLELRTNTSKELYKEFAKTNPSTPRDKLICELLRRLTVLESKVLQLETSKK